METRRLADLLTETPLAEGLERKEVNRLAEVGEVRAVDRGEVLIEEGIRGSALLVILDGAVEVLKSHGGGEPHRLVTLEKRTVLGEIGLVLGEPASATIRTIRASTVFALGRDRFRELVNRRDGAATSLTLALAKVLATRLRRMNEEAVTLCERYEEVLAEAGEAKKGARRAELARFKEQLLSEWNF